MTNIHAQCAGELSMRPNTLFKPICLLILGALALVPGRAEADEVTDWNAVLLRAIQTAATPGALQGRLGAIVHVAMFDAYNGVERRYTPIHVTLEAPRGASARAAVVYAAYTALTCLFPSQSFTADLESSLAGIADDSAYREQHVHRERRRLGAASRPGDPAVAQHGWTRYLSVHLHWKYGGGEMAADASSKPRRRRASWVERFLPVARDHDAVCHSISVELPFDPGAAGAHERPIRS
jgi:hypothetical protein